MSGACSTYGEMRGVCRVLVGKTDGKRPLGRPRRKWKENINIDLHKLGFGGHGLERSGLG